MSDSDLFSKKRSALDSLVQWGVLTREEYYKCIYALTQKTLKIRIEEDGSGTVYFDGDPLADDKSDYDNEYEDDEYEDDEYEDDEYEDDEYEDDEYEDDDKVAPEPVFVKAGDIAYEDENVRLTYRGIKEFCPGRSCYMMYFVFIVENLTPYTVNIRAVTDLNGFEANDDDYFVRKLAGKKKRSESITVHTDELQEIYIHSYEDLKKIQITFTYKIIELNYEKETVANEYEIIQMS